MAMTPAFQASCLRFSLQDFFVWLNRGEFTKEYVVDLTNKIHKIFGKSIYQNTDELFEELKHKTFDKYSCLAIRKVLKYLEIEGVDDRELLRIKKLLKPIRSNPDMFVPTTNEIKATFEKLKPHHQLMYKLFLASGLRRIEGKYILDHRNEMEVQDMGEFVKINMSSFRKNKNCFFCYLPKSFWKELLVSNQDFSISKLIRVIKEKDLISIKYCRKWFFTECISLGIPESIADFYEGRSSQGIGSSHYLARQRLADEYYPKIKLPI